MTPQELKASILQLAIQGKLVEQRLEEGTGEELYQQVQEEKQRLVKSGVIKKEKPLPEITEDEIPFDIPESWKWVRLGSCSTYDQRKRKVSATEIGADMWSLDLEDIEKDTGRIVNRCPASARTIVGDKICFQKDQVLYSKLRPYLKKVLVAPDDGICSSEIVPFSMYGQIDAQYIVYVLTSPHVDYVINSVTYGIKMPRVGTETMTNLLIPLPPLAEQKRIVAKIEELLPYIERYEQAWSKLEDFNKRFPVDMQKSILQMAIQGKLVEQRPEEGTGEELYQQIQQEKLKLIKAGKIKKEKPLPEISEDEKPFEIPESWMWVRLLEVIDEKPTNGYSPKGVDYETKVRNLTLTATTSGKFKEDAFKYIDIQLEDDSKYWLRYDDLLIQRSNSRELVGTSCIFTGKDKTYIYPDLMMRMRVVEGVSVNYIDYVLKSPMVREYFMSKASGTSESMPKINQGIVSNTVIPLPPLAEQKRIVAKLEEILPLCERLK